MISDWKLTGRNNRRNWHKKTFGVDRLYENA
jgi:hypothetical protein